MRIIERRVVGERQSVPAAIGDSILNVAVDNEREYVILVLVITPSAFTDGDLVELLYKGGKIMETLYMDGSSLTVEFGEKLEELHRIERKTQPALRYYNVAAQAKTVYYDITRGYIG